MGVHQQPDPAKQIADITARLDRIESIVRRGKPAPNFRDLADADLTKVADGQVPVYDAATGRWVPGSGSGEQGVFGAFHFGGGGVAEEGTIYGSSWTLLASDGTGVEESGGVITVTESGWYDLSCTALWQGAMTGDRIIYYLINSAFDFDTASEVLAAGLPGPHVYHQLGLVTAPLSAGDTISVGFRTESSGDQSLGLQLYVKRVR